MVKVRLSLNSTLYYAWSHLSVLAGIVLAVAVLVGALLVGDSVRYTLTRAALLRLGGAHHALEAKGRYFGADLAERLQAGTSVAMAPALLFRGVAIGPSGRQVNAIQIAGVDERFRGLGGACEAGLPDDGVVVNTKLAAELGVKPGDSLSLRFGKPSLLPHDAPLSSRKGDDTVRGTFTVVAIWGEDHSGRFSLAANQLVPCNAFVSLKSLQALAGLPGKANLILAGESLAGKAAVRVSGEELDRAVKSVWRQDDIGLTWRESSDGTRVQLESDRVMLDPAVGRLAAETGDAAGTLTYLVNSISVGEGPSLRTTPYSFVMAMAPIPGFNLLPTGMKDDEILVNRWLANQLSIVPGAAVKVAYYEFTPWGRFVETNRVFRVCGIVGMERMRLERELAPRFPGLTDAGRCADWDIGMPLDEKKMEDPANEAYWDAYRDTPKAFVTLKAGQAMWANRFGDLTAIRFKKEGLSKAEVGATLLRRLEPSELGFSFSPVRHTALKAAGEAMDFGQLFLGMSSFVMVAALMLTAMLFSFSIQQRSRETGILLAVGFTPARVRGLLIREGIWVAGVGSIVGAGLGVCYTRALILALNHSWQGAVASMSVHFHAEPETVIVGSMAGLVIAITTLMVAAWRQAGRPVGELLAGKDGEGTGAGPGSPTVWGVVLPGFGLAGATALVVHGVSIPLSNRAGLFFAAGSLLLVSLLGLIRLYLVRLASARGRLTLAALGVRNIGRSRRRSLTVIGLLAVGCFMVFAVSSMQENVERDAAQRASGTGGFALFGECSVPILADFTSPAGWGKLRLDQEPALTGVEVLPIKVRDGDDSSCLNLNRAQIPRLLGVDPVALEKRGAFAAPWSLLLEPSPDGCVPGLIGDANTAQWGLRKTVGEVLPFTDEQGRIVRVKVVGVLPVRVSIFQGSVLIAANRFSQCYPSESGTRMFLADVPAGAGPEVRDVLARRLGKYGLEVNRTVDRLKAFHAVESTYLTMFLVLGGLGLLLGSVGMAIVVLRAIRERRAEFALLKAVGYSDRQVRRMIVGEHRLMLGLGLATGVVSSLAAMWPNLHEPGVTLPLATMLTFLAGMILFHTFWIGISIGWAWRASLLDALRNP